MHTVKLPAGPHGALPVDEPAPRDAGHARRARVVVLLDPEHDPRRRPAPLLFDMDMAIQRLAATVPDHPSTVQLTGVYHNLLRQWAEL